MATTTSSNPDSLPGTANEELPDSADQRKQDEPNAEVQPASTTEAKPQPPAGEGKEPVKPNAVDIALERIRTGEASTVDKEPEPNTTAPEKPADPAKPKVEPKAEDPAKPTEAKSKRDPIDDWDTQEKAHTKGRTKERFRKLDELYQTERTNRETAEKRLAELELDANHGKAFREIGEKHKVQEDFDYLDDEQIAFSVKSQASILRAVKAITEGKKPSVADMEILEDVSQGLELVKKHLGIAKPDIDVNGINAAIEEADSTGDFTKLRELVGKLSTGQTQPGTATQAPTARTQQAPASAGDTSSSAQPDPWAVSTINALVRSGIKQDQVETYYKGTLLPEVRSALTRDFPRLNPDVAWKKLSGEARTAKILEAHATVVGRQHRSPPVVPASRPLPPSGPIRTGARATRAQAAVSTGNPVTDAIQAVRDGRAASHD